MKDLIKKFREFKENSYDKEKDFYSSLKNGQNPETLFITCSDSRVRPNAITGTKEGELFVIRNAGNYIPVFGEQSDLSICATIEFAVSVLAVKNIVVCGHADCGAIGAKMSESVPKEAACLYRYMDCLPDFSSKNIDDNIRHNVKHQLKNLMTYDFVAKAHLAGKLNLYGWVYFFDRGLLEVLEGNKGTFDSPFVNQEDLY